MNGLFVGRYDSLHQRVSHDIARLKSDDCYFVDRPKPLDGILQPAGDSRGQIDLGGIA